MTEPREGERFLTPPPDYAALPPSTFPSPPPYFSPFLSEPGGLIIDVPDTSDDSGAALSDLRDQDSTGEGDGLATLQEIQAVLTAEVKTLEKEEEDSCKREQEPQVGGSARGILLMIFV